MSTEYINCKKLVITNNSGSDTITISVGKGETLSLPAQAEVLADKVRSGNNYLYLKDLGNDLTLFSADALDIQSQNNMAINSSAGSMTVSCGGSMIVNGTTGLTLTGTSLTASAIPSSTFDKLYNSNSYSIVTADKDRYATNGVNFIVGNDYWANTATTRGSDISYGGNGRFTINKTANYIVSVSMSVEAYSVNMRSFYLAFKKDGVESYEAIDYRAGAPGTDNCITTLTVSRNILSGTEIFMRFYQNSGTSLRLLSGWETMRLGVFLLG